ncbi:MAG TPA: Dabb family protein [Bacteroidales bacterium]|nr:Dabb family protein [Bacteroidales bacterium]HPO65215.1 Dabb family protein [Bacteroidales bacterium]
MVRHVVCWQLKPNFSTDEKLEKLQLMKDALLNLQKKISVIRQLEVGINDPSIDPNNYDICLIVSFDTADDLQHYQNHPEHLTVKELVKSIAHNRACVDYNF